MVDHTSLFLKRYLYQRYTKCEIKCISQVVQFLALFSIAIQGVQSQSQTQPGNHPNVPSNYPYPNLSNQSPIHSAILGSVPNSNPTVGDLRYGHYTYQRNGAIGAGAMVYKSPPVSRNAYGYPMFGGVANKADFSLSNYIGPIFWSTLAVAATVIVSALIFNFFAGTNVFGGIVEKIKNSGAVAKAMNFDVDRLTIMVHTALDNYKKITLAEAKIHNVNENDKKT